FRRDSIVKVSFSENTAEGSIRRAQRPYEPVLLGTMAEGNSSGPVVVGPPLETAKWSCSTCYILDSRRSHAVALYTPAGEPDWTLSLGASSDGVARGYLGLGVRPGDRVASLLPNCAELMIHYIACAKIGLGNVIADELEVHGPGDGRAQRKDDLARLTVRPPLGIVAVGGHDDENVAHFSELMKEEGPPVVIHPEAKGDAPAIVFFTSGSTGKPKGDTHSYNTYGYCLASFIQALDVTEKDIIMPCGDPVQPGGAGRRGARCHSALPMRTINRYGTVEDVLMTHAAVDQAGVVGSPDVVHGENVKAYITLKEGIAAAPSELELIEHCRVQIGYKSPESIEILPSMPLNPTGKVDRRALKEQSTSVMPKMVQTVARSEEGLGRGTST
ncbi:hypothetical protein THAOC_14164, partial [Thalassiosira oceanica]